MKPIARTRLPLAGVLLAGAAHAHHPTGDAMPVTAVEGLLSGLAHPVIGLEHLLFLLAAATLVGLSRHLPGRGIPALLLFPAASLLGTTLWVPGLTPPVLELLIGASLLTAAACLLRRRSMGLGPVLLLMLAAAGFLHGQAYGEAVIGAEATPVGGYLLGLLLVQCGLSLPVFLLVRRAFMLAPARLHARVRMLGLAVGAAGAVFTGLALLS